MARMLLPCRLGHARTRIPARRGFTMCAGIDGTQAIRGKLHDAVYSTAGRSFHRSGGYTTRAWAPARAPDKSGKYALRAPRKATAFRALTHPATASCGYVLRDYAPDVVGGKPRAVSKPQ